MKKTLASLALVAATIFVPAQAALVTTTGSITVENGVFNYDEQSFGSGSIWDQVFGNEVPAANWFGSFDITDLSLDGIPPAFDQMASWTMGAEGSVDVTGDLASQGTTVRTGESLLSEAGSVEFDLGTFAMSSQFDPALAINDYDQVFNAFLTALMPRPAGPAPTLEEIFNAVNGITTEDLFGLVTAFIDDTDTLALLTTFASSTKIAILDDTVVFVSSAPGLQVENNGMMLDVTSLSGEFGGTAYLQAQYVSAPATLAIVLLGLGGIFLRKRAK